VLWCESFALGISQPGWIFQPLLDVMSATTRPSRGVEPRAAKEGESLIARDVQPRHESPTRHRGAIGLTARLDYRDREPTSSLLYLLFGLSAFGPAASAESARSLWPSKTAARRSPHRG